MGNGVIVICNFVLFLTDLQLQLRLLREWLKRMESKVPKLVLRPKWTRETLDRRIVEYKVSCLFLSLDGGTM
jgi:hypothetical protein